MRCLQPQSPTPIESLARNRAAAATIAPPLCSHPPRVVVPVDENGLLSVDIYVDSIGDDVRAYLGATYAFRQGRPDDVLDLCGCQVNDVGAGRRP